MNDLLVFCLLLSLVSLLFYGDRHAVGNGFEVMSVAAVPSQVSKKYAAMFRSRYVPSNERHVIALLHHALLGD